MTEEEGQKLLQQMEALRQENKLLKEKLDLLIRRVYGSQSEKVDPDQLELLPPDEDAKKANASVDPDLRDQWLAEASHSPAVSSPSSTWSKDKSRPRIPENLPVIEEVIEPDIIRDAPGDWRKIGEERSELLDYQPGHFFIRRTIRPRYVQRLDHELPPVIAPLPSKLIEGGMVAPGLLAQVVIGKYMDHLPLYRQEQIFVERYGVCLPRQTLARWIEFASHWLEPIYREIASTIFSTSYLQVDETPLHYLAPGNGRTKTGYFWTYHQVGGDTLYDWHPSRSTDCLRKRIPDEFGGILQCDAYSAYRTFSRERSGIHLAGCMAHVRRKFFEARDSEPEHAAWMLRQIGHLYQVEKELRRARAGPVLREATRQSESRPILGRILRQLQQWENSGRFLPQSLMGKAIRYALGQWDALQVYLWSGAVEIDNNLVENRIRPTALGKKNFLFIGDEQAGQRSAIIYTVITSCRNHGVEPFSYLRDVFERLPAWPQRRIGELVPRHWSSESAMAA